MNPQQTDQGRGRTGLAAPATSSPRPQLSAALTSFSAEDPGDWEWMLEQAQALDAGGVDRLVVSDHVAFGEDLHEYGRPELGGRVGGSQPTGPDGHWLEPLTTLSVVAGRTARIRLGTNILLAALRRPVVLAKVTATLDVLSRGRLDLGVGVGWQQAEYAAAGLDFDDRGRLLDHTLEVCQTLWRQPRATYDTPELCFDHLHQSPKPLQEGGVPLWVSGTVQPRVVRRLARFGLRWIPWGPAADNVVEGIRQMRQALDRSGIDPTGLQVVGHLPLDREQRHGHRLHEAMDRAPELVAAGVTDIRVALALPREGGIDIVRACADAFHRAVG